MKKAQFSGAEKPGMCGKHQKWHENLRKSSDYMGIVGNNTRNCILVYNIMGELQ
jgi:hypothetical protein